MILHDEKALEGKNMTDTMQTQKIFFAMGTVKSVTVFEPADEALSAIKDRVLNLNRRLNAYTHDSEIAEVNRNAGIRPAVVSADTFALIEHSIRFANLTDGCFDITSRHLSQLWKDAMKSSVFPDDAAIQYARSFVNYQDIILDSAQCTVMLKHKGQQLDLGGIAKGYAADEVRLILLEYGIRNAVINFGGTVINLGLPRRIGLQTPFAPNGQHFASVLIHDGQAVVSSGLYEQCRIISGKIMHHIISPRTGYPADSGLTAVTLVGQNAAELDALATAAMILGIENSIPLLKERSIEAVFIRSSGEIYVTESLAANLKWKGK